MPDPFEFEVGMEVGGATLEEKIGEGGQAIVFKARYCGQKVAVKVINPRLNPNLIEDSLQRFDREQNILLALKHENIVEVKAAGTHKYWFQSKAFTIPYLIMELMAGSVYNSATGPISWAEVVKIGIDAAEGLIFVHHQGLHHRDIKPSNILINEKGKAKIADFGFARAMGTNSFSLTLPYASPEQHDPHQCTDHISDIYSLGVTCYEMLTGRWPFEANEGALLQFIRGLSEPASIDVEAPEELKALIMKMIKLKRSERPQSVEEVLDVLKELKPDDDFHNGEGKLKTRFHLKYIAIAALLSTIFAISTLYYTGKIGNKPTLPPDEPFLISEVGQPANGPKETTLVNGTVNAPAIDFKAVPGYGDQGMLEGTVSFVEPSKYRVAVYVMVRGRWWTKPYWDQPLTVIMSNGSWECDIFTGELDHETNRIAAYLLPEGYDPPLVRGDASLPEELNSISVASDFIDRSN